MQVDESRRQYPVVPGDDGCVIRRLDGDGGDRIDEPVDDEHVAALQRFVDAIEDADVLDQDRAAMGIGAQQQDQRIQ